MSSNAPALAVVFDCDGVLVDSEAVAYRVAGDVLARHGVEIQPDVLMSRFLGQPLTTMTAVLSDEHGVDLSTGFEPDMRAQMLVAMETVDPIPGIDDLLAGLGVPRCVASSSEIVRVETALTSTGLIRHFNGHLYTAEMVARPKPAPDLFLHGAARLDTPPERCVVVEDSTSGVKAAIDAGMTPIGFAGGSHAIGDGFRDRLRTAGAVEIAEDTDDLAAALHARLAGTR